MLNRAHSTIVVHELMLAQHLLLHIDRCLVVVSLLLHILARTRRGFRGRWQKPSLLLLQKVIHVLLQQGYLLVHQELTAKFDGLRLIVILASRELELPLLNLLSIQKGLHLCSSAFLKILLFPQKLIRLHALVQSLALEDFG